MLSRQRGYLCALGALFMIVGCSETNDVPATASAKTETRPADKQETLLQDPIGESRYKEGFVAEEIADADGLASDMASEPASATPHAPVGGDAAATVEQARDLSVAEVTTHNLQDDRFRQGAAKQPQAFDLRSKRGLTKSLDGVPTPGIVHRGGGAESPDLFGRDAAVDDADQGRGPGQGGDKYASITDNPFQEVKSNPLSTFSIDVDTASYSKVRMYLMQHGQLPPPEAVRIEELINYFDYDYVRPVGDEPFASNVEITACPWQPKHRLVRVGIKGKVIENDQRPLSNLVFLLDVSGSMNQPNKLPLVKEGMRLLVSQLGENDRVAIVVYAGAAGLVLPSTPCDQQEAILAALDHLAAGGSTNGGEGIRLAYQTALEYYIPGGVNRVVLCTDGDFNVGETSTGGLVSLAAAKANGKQGVSLSVLGFGMGNHNDSMLEEISNKGNGNYAFIDNEREARKVLVEQASGTLVTIAKDVKIQIEFNPARVAAYRLIGYENRMLAAEDFKDDKKDAGEIGAGHTVTALYELVPAGIAGQADVRGVDSLKYQTTREATEAAASDELLTLKIRYKQPDADTSLPLEFPFIDDAKPFGEASPELKFAAAVASFGMILRDSEHRGQTSYDAVLEIAADGARNDEHGYRAEFLAMIRQAKTIAER